MKTYEAVFNELQTEGVFGISLVENPAMEGLFVALNKQQELQLKEVDKEQRILMGLVLEPNKPVYRNQNNEEFNIVFNEQTIKNLSYHFFKKGNQKNSTIEHEDKINGVTFVESWIVEDTKKDKSALYGFSYPVGSWVATMKVDSEDVWNNYVKTGKVQGFSIDAMLELKEVNLKSELNMSEQKNGVLAALKKATSFITNLSETEVKDEVIIEEKIEVTLGAVKSKDGEVTFEFEGDDLAIDVALWVMSEDGEKIAVPEGEYLLEDDRTLVVGDEGKVSEIKTMEEAPKEEVVEEMNEETPVSDSSKTLDEIKSILIKYQEQNETLSKGIEDLKTSLTEFAAQPISKPVQVIKQVELTKSGRLLAKLRK